MKNKALYIATEEEILAGQVTDIYFERTREILEAENLHKRVVMESVVKHFPSDYPWAVFAGLEEVLKLLIGKDIDVWAMPEGTLFSENDPVLIIEGDYLDFGPYETALLGMLCQASGIATRAARCKKAADGRPVYSFGIRRMHPAIAPMIDRSAYIGGLDGVAVVKSAEMLGLKPVGTIPHALILIKGDTVAAAKSFNEIIDKNIPRVVLIDTFTDEKFEAIRVAEELGDALFAVRLDTPGNRRGNFLSILKEVRWELNLRGFGHVKLFASGGLDERSITELNAVVDSYGVGTAISNAPVLDFSMDIVEIEGKPIAKRGKISGRKQVWRAPNTLTSTVLPEGVHPQSPDVQPLLKKVIEKGRLLEPFPSLSQIRDRVLKQLDAVEL